MEYLAKYPEVGNYVDDLMGVVKQLGVHAGAVIIFDDVMDKYVSMVKIKGKDIIANNGVECEAIG